MIAAFNPLRPLENLLEDLLQWFHDTAGLSWSWSIVAIVVLVRIILVPVTVRQIHSMQNLQAHAPEMKEIQQRWKHDRQRQNEELMKFYRENKINPAASCLPIVLQIPIFIALFWVLKDAEKTLFTSGSLEFLGLVNITEPTVDGWGPLLLVVYVASQLTSSYYMSASMQRAQRILLLVLPIVFIPFILNFPAGLMVYWLTTNLWTTGQGFITRRLMPKPVAAGAREEDLADAAEGGAEGGGDSGLDGIRLGRPEGRRARGRRAAEAGEAKAERRRPAPVSEELSVEATGETVGEAKWSALRELERLAPGIDRDAVRFQVVSEGERGLLGVGYAPARVVATAERPAAPAATAPVEAAEGEPAVARELLERVVTALGVDARVELAESDDEVVATVTGGDLGVLIGRHGQMIDALQYLANAIAHRSVGEERRRIVVDAAGYRARRSATLETLARRSAEQASATGRRVELEPMSAVERRIVHEALKDDPEVETASEGVEPNRYVVVLPRRSAD